MWDRDWETSGPITLQWNILCVFTLYTNVHRGFRNMCTKFQGSSINRYWIKLSYAKGTFLPVFKNPSQPVMESFLIHIQATKLRSFHALRLFSSSYQDYHQWNKARLYYTLNRNEMASLQPLETFWNYCIKIRI